MPELPIPCLVKVGGEDASLLPSPVSARVPRSIVDPVAADMSCVKGAKFTYRGGNELPKGVPRRNGSGKGIRANRGRGGCSPTKKTGKGGR